MITSCYNFQSNKYFFHKCTQDEPLQTLNRFLAQGVYNFLFFKVALTNFKKFLQQFNFLNLFESLFVSVFICGSVYLFIFFLGM